MFKEQGERILPESRDQVHTEARTLVGFPDKGWGHGGDKATVRDVT